MVPVSTFALETDGEFNENTHAFYTKHVIASAKRAQKNDALDDYDSILCQFWCHPWCQKEKGQRLNTSDLSF